MMDSLYWDEKRKRRLMDLVIHPHTKLPCFLYTYFKVGLFTTCKGFWAHFMYHILFPHSSPNKPRIELITCLLQAVVANLTIFSHHAGSAGSP